jgi:hypothetical protein
MRRALRILLVLQVAHLAASPAAAWFEITEVGGRAAGLGDAFVSVADDASAIVWNPAGLVQLVRHEALFASDRANGLEGLSTDFLAVAAHAGGFSFAAGWRRQALDDAAAEDLVLVGASRTLVRRSLGAFVSAGAALEFARVGLETAGFEHVAGLRDSDSGLAGTTGVLLQPIPNVTAAAVVRHIGQPTFDLVAGGGRSRLDAEFEWGLSLRWREDGRVHVAHVRTSGGRVATRAGAEVRVAGALWVRAGASRDGVSGGLGLGWRGWGLDWAYRADDALGATTRVGLRREFGRVRDAVGSTYDEF